MLKSLLEKWACKHQWEIWSTNKVPAVTPAGQWAFYQNDMDIPMTTYQTLVCKCGKLKKIKL